MGHSKDSEVSNTGAGCHSFTKVPVIVAEIGAQSVDVQDQSHDAAQQFCKHFSALDTRGKNTHTKKTQDKKKRSKNRRMKSERGRERVRMSVPSQSPSLSGCLCENKSTSPSIIPAEVHKVDNPYVASLLTHDGFELQLYILLGAGSWELEGKREQR